MAGTDTAIRVEGLSKRYLIGHDTSATRGHETLRDALTRNIGQLGRTALAMARGRAIIPGDEIEEFWALRDVSFEVRRGEVMGVIGHNGAGKSTLLKILSRITEPTEGRIVVGGRVASLLEVGTGFHPELTGRENIFLNGAILGMSRAEVRAKFDEIVVFAEVERFLDTPVKRYSSGMYVRLAFSVAAHLEPEILIVDEVLAVGDAEFQKKCLGKMQAVAGHGRTVLFVSHNMGAISRLCERVAVLSGGRLQAVESADRAVARYLGVQNGVSTRPHWTWPAEIAPGGPELRFQSVSVEGGQPGATHFRPDEPLSIVLRYEQLAALTGARVVVSLLTANGEVAFAGTDQAARDGGPVKPGSYESRCTIPGGLLNRRSYVIRIQAGIPDQRALVEPVEIGAFSVDAPVGNEHGVVGATWPGVVCPELKWTFRRVDAAQDLSRVAS